MSGPHASFRDYIFGKPYLRPTLISGTKVIVFIYRDAFFFIVIFSALLYLNESISVTLMFLVILIYYMCTKEREKNLFKEEALSPESSCASSPSPTTKL